MCIHLYLEVYYQPLACDVSSQMMVSGKDIGEYLIRILFFNTPYSIFFKDVL